MITGILLLFTTLPVFGQSVTVELDTTTVAGKSVYVAAMEARMAANIAGAAILAARVDSQLTADDLDFSAVGGITVLPDSVDRVWVQMQFPVASATGLAKIILQDIMVVAIREYNAKENGVGRLRFRDGRATEFLRDFAAKLNP
tara:strand:+ start:6103 stop:6534 length:432 start_codon:yes stop_codon:yes gene_type:complete